MGKKRGQGREWLYRQISLPSAEKPAVKNNRLSVAGNLNSSRHNGRRGNAVKRRTRRPECECILSFLISMPASSFRLSRCVRKQLERTDNLTLRTIRHQWTRRNRLLLETLHHPEQLKVH